MPDPIRISLTPEQKQRAEDEAVRRQSGNQAQGLRGRNRAPAVGDRALQMHRLGTTGEVAVAAHLGLEDHLFAETTANRGSCDLPGDIEVKTRSRHGYDLIVQKDERLDKRLVLVTIERDKVFLHGWCVAGDVMREEFWADPAGGRPAYFVPKRNLRDIGELHDLLASVESLKTP